MPAVAVDRKVAKLVQRAVVRNLRDEIRRQCSVAVFAGHVVDAVACDEEFSSQIPCAAAALANASGNHGAVLVVIARKKVPVKLTKHGTRNTKFGIFHCERSQSITFASFTTAVSVSGSR
jgi:hypothetical protein